MATAFQSGFKLGGDAFNQAERNRMAREELALAKERDARAAEEFGWRRDAETRQRAQNAEIDSLTQQLTRPNADNYAFAPRGAGTGGLGLRVGNQPAAEMPAEGLVMPQLATGAVAPGLRMPAQGEPAAATGLRAQAMPDRPLTFNQAPTGAAAEDILGRLALVRGDTAGFRASQVAARGFKFEDGLKARYAEFDAMSDEDRAKLVDRISLDQSIPGNGTWVPGKGKQAGYMNWTPPGKDPIKLSAKEARDLFALTNLMEIDPVRARAEMDKVSAQVRALAKDTFDTQVKGVTANNQATRFANADDIARQELGVKRGQAAATAEYYRNRGNMDRMGAAQYFTGQDGNTYASIPRMGRNGLTFETVRVNPDGVKLNKVGGGPDMKPADVKEEGTKVTIGGRLMFADGLGGFIPGNANGKPAGVLPSERQAALKKAGVPDNVIDRLEWNKDGTAVALNGMRFDLSELKNIKTEYERLGRNEIIAEEDRKRSLGMHSALNRMRNAPPVPDSTSGFGPTITYRPAPNAPSIYAGPAEWEAYRRYQQSLSE